MRSYLTIYVLKYLSYWKRIWQLTSPSCRGGSVPSEAHAKLGSAGSKRQPATCCSKMQQGPQLCRPRTTAATGTRSASTVGDVSSQLRIRKNSGKEYCLFEFVQQPCIMFLLLGGKPGCFQGGRCSQQL